MLIFMSIPDKGGHSVAGWQVQLMRALLGGCESRSGHTLLGCADRVHTLEVHTHGVNRKEDHKSHLIALFFTPSMSAL